MTIQALLILGAIIGFVAAVLFANPRLGCVSLWIIPITMVATVIVDQRLHPESVRSTSALDFMFAPLWPSLGAIAGFLAGRLTRSFIAKARRHPGA